MNENTPVCPGAYCDLTSDQILDALPKDFPWRNQLHCYSCIDSTNTVAKKAASTDAAEGTAFIADCQSAGRGRLGRTFLSPKGMGIYLSVILRPACTPDKIMHLTCAVAVAIRSAIVQCCGLQAGIKWTNDLVVGKYKLAGILTELSINRATGLVDFAVVGVGINCCQQSNDFPAELKDIATSIAISTGDAVDRNRLCAALLIALHNMRQSLFLQKNTLMDAYRANCITLGQRICITGAGPVRYALATDIDDEGGLIVRHDSGALETITSGEVSVRGMYGYI